MPDLDIVLRETNRLLAERGLQQCEHVAPMADQDTANPTFIGSVDSPLYVIKASFRHPKTLEQQLCIANAVADSTGLPIPRHLCHASEPEPLPLMIMEWMPGEQLRTVLPAVDGEVAAELVRDWGGCIAKFHHAQLGPEPCADWPDLSEAHSGFVRWLRGIVHERLETLAKDSSWSAEAGTVRTFLAERDESLDTPASPGLVKADQGIRDALALLEPRPHISALVDWERVSPGDTLWELASILVRMDIDGLWPDFHEGYAKEAEPPLPPGPHSDFYVMTWALIQVTWGEMPKPRYERARAIIDGLLAGRSPWLQSQIGSA